MTVNPGSARAQRSDVVRIVLWNIEWRRVSTPAGRAMKTIIESLQPDIVCLTEGHEDFLDWDHRLSSRPDYGYPIKRGRRKVLLWSRAAWVNVDDLDSADMPGGRYVAGTTQTPVGPLRAVGVCIPWADAHVASGRRDRRKWEDHLRFIGGLEESLEDAPRTEPMILLGDFNQTIPRRRQPLAAYDALRACLGTSLALATSGTLPGTDRLAIDHLAHSPELKPLQIKVLPEATSDGLRLSDHFGFAIDLTRATSGHTGG